MTHYVCSSCGAAVDHDEQPEGRPILACGCDPSEANPIEVPYRSEAEEWDDWIRRR